MTSWVRQHEAWDLLAIDHLPACPDCGDLAHPGATICDGCGAHLFVRVTSTAARNLSVARAPVDEETEETTNERLARRRATYNEGTE